MNFNVEKGLVRISGHKNPEAVLRRYRLTNPDYISAKAANRNMYGIEKYEYFAEIDNGDLLVPLPCYKGDVEIPVHRHSFSDKPIDLRDYQAKAVDEWGSQRYGILQACAGSGKTICGCELIRRREVNSLVIVPTVDIMNQWCKSAEMMGFEFARLGGGTGNTATKDSPAIVATFHSAVKNPEIMEKTGCIIVDECFTAGTAIKTPYGDVAIENIKKGDFVYNATGKGIVTKTFRSLTKDIWEVKLSNGKQFECTGSHPIFTDKGWKAAREMERGQRVVCVQDMPVLWGENETQHKEGFRGQCNTSDERRQIPKKKVLQQFLQNESQQPYEGFWNQRENASNDIGNGAQTSFAGRQREENASTTEELTGNAAYFESKLGAGAHSENRKKAGEISLPLQVRPCFARGDDLYRGGRANPLWKEKTSRPEENRFTDIVRVESITCKKQSCKRLVYNLEVSGHPSYFAENTLVHNCHRTPCRSIRDILAECPARYRHGVTATPWRSDSLHHSLDWLLGGVTTVVERDAVSEHVIDPIVRKVITKFSPIYIANHPNASVIYQNQIAMLDKRNQFIARHIAEARAEGHSVLALCNRVDQMTEIKKYLKMFAVDITGSTPKKKREQIFNLVRKGGVNILLATYRLAGEGLDVPNLSCIVQCAPISNPTLIEQSSGRVARPHKGKQQPVVIDFEDQDKMSLIYSKKRDRVYRKLNYEIRRTI